MLIQTSSDIFELNMGQSGRMRLVNIYIKKMKKMIKKLLSKIFYLFSNTYKKDQIEKYLSKSKDLYDLEYRQKELSKNNNFNFF
tara:strand:+ start:434 stop:685 length:252 start_codon:yes stop_codon:yes gene_type:complete